MEVPKCPTPSPLKFCAPRLWEELNKVGREASERAYAEGMLDLIRRGVISTGYDGQLSGISVDALLRKLQQHGSPIANYSKDELRSEPEATLNDFDVQDPSCY